MKAMILAAGLGTRMAPLTQRRPKPALPILGEPMIRRLVIQLVDAGITSVVVNVHAHADVLRRVLEDVPLPVHLSLETELLGSAGGIRAARAHLDGPDPFLVLNADMVLDLDVAALRRAHEATDAPVTLLLRDDPRKRRFGSIGCGTDHKVCRITDRITTGTEATSGLYTGVQIMSPSIFEKIPDRPVSQLVPDVYVPLLRDGGGLACAMQAPSLAWWPVGTPAELLDANLRALRERTCDVLIHPDAEVRGRVRAPAWIGPRALVPAGCELGPDVVVGADSRLPDGCRATQMLFLCHACPPQSAPLQRAIAFDQEVWRDG